LILATLTSLASLGIDHPQSASFRAVAASDDPTGTRDGGQRNGSEHECQAQCECATQPEPTYPVESRWNGLAGTGECLGEHMDLVLLIT
jgi:hypothetical protein